MTSDRRKQAVAPKARVADGRYLRWSWRYNAWQIRSREGVWHNCNVPMARCYATMGFPIGVQGVSTGQ